jgi:uridine kinase
MSGNSRRVVSICGPTGSGKSQIAKALVERLGPDRCVRIPTDYFLLPSDPSMAQPFRWDWPMLKRVLALPDGTELTTPSFDFERTRRLAETGGWPFTLRSMALIDAMEPYPRSDLTVLIAVPEAVRRARIVARDEVWGSRVRDRWERLEATWRSVAASRPAFDIELDGTEPLDLNVARLVERFEAT